MALIPSKPKFRKQQKGTMRGKAKAGQFVQFGDYGMQILERGRITNQQIEACRVAINRYFSRKGKVWIRIFPDKPITKKPAETRMGKGKGGTDHWVAVALPGRILFEVANVTREEAQTALLKAAAKLPFRTRFVERMEQV
ncbi:MAG: 50S ribosomal protein L16 [Simkania sp.]|jgi:large subunit ribosomal protein L16|uniref:Large ribosomal subunit protein uL16 n=1 Tax=Simkania negevensis (strain ATCC VR-1471 / DSM 27360 / Z) TaxID=331113 RepID=F8L3W8_SIMNZ|nr:50S ribosomal protein L16 [Simkania sp.]MCB1074441.1 50S ribosomal protein L16 [Simkania sp.]MCB1083248.1 50S ribosomal protein L16 [Simkania sp.]MCP5489711.1 50S ribosomal protein L16 [Chlamydiales bacterium]CCB89998.1 50S ribosomal protein L16 [Simkania negevensis Z]